MTLILSTPRVLLSAKSEVSQIDQAEQSDRCNYGDRKERVMSGPWPILLLLARYCWQQRLLLHTSLWVINQQVRAASATGGHGMKLRRQYQLDLGRDLHKGLLCYYCCERRVCPDEGELGER